MLFGPSVLPSRSTVPRYYSRRRLPAQLLGRWAAEKGQLDRIAAIQGLDADDVLDYLPVEQLVPEGDWAGTVALTDRVPEGSVFG